MKTLQIVPALDQGGVERGVVEMNRVISSEGWRNVVVSSGGRLVAQIERDGGRHVALDVKGKNPLTCLSRAAALRRVLESERPDVVCVHSRVPAWLFRIANRGLGLKWITFAHGANSISPYSRVMTAGDLVVTPSRLLEDYLKDDYGTPEERIRVIPRAIDAARFDPSRLDMEFVGRMKREWGVENSRVVMGLGRITQLKGYDILIHAARYLKATHEAARVKTPAYKFVIVGEAEEGRRKYAAELVALAERLGVKDDVVFAGAQSKVAECLSIADVVVSANYRKPESFGRSMAEALAMNRPVVATAFGGALDIVKDGVNGALVAKMQGEPPEERAVAFANAIRCVVHSKFGDLRSDVLERFSFERMAKASLDVYRELAAKGAAGGKGDGR